MTLERAIVLAARAHAGQLDKQGVPYIRHPLRVMEAVSDASRVAAVLHDVVEDTATTLGALREQGVDRATVAAIDLVTRPPKDAPARPTYREFIDRIVLAPRLAGAIAREVKVADINDNLGRLTPEMKGMEERYAWALERLAGR